MNFATGLALSIFAGMVADKDPGATMIMAGLYVVGFMAINVILAFFGLGGKK